MPSINTAQIQQHIKAADALQKIALIHSNDFVGGKIPSMIMPISLAEQFIRNVMARSQND